MIFGSPTTWVIYELIALTLFVACLAHAARRPDATRHVLTLAGFVVFAGTFENIGVAANIYDYNLDRLLMVGTVPLSILFVESVIFYAAMWLVEYLRIPWLAGAWIIGFLGSYQDLTIDPSNVFDLHTVHGELSGQWNWTMNYDGGLFGIPFFNFSGWLTMMAYYAFFIGLFRMLARKQNWTALDTYSPLIAIVPSLILLVSPINSFLLAAWPIGAQGQLIPELVMLIINFAVAIVLLLRFIKLDKPISLARDWLMFAVPVVLHVWDIVLALTQGIEQAIVPSLLFGLPHIALLVFVAIRGRSNARRESLNSHPDLATS